MPNGCHKQNKMKYKTKANKIGNESLAVLGLRIIETAEKSGMNDAKLTKQFLHLVSVNERFQNAILSGNLKLKTASIDALFNKRNELFLQMYNYLNGLIDSPDAEMKAAATLLFNELDKFGKNFARLKLADKSLRFIRIVQNLKKPECEPALVKTLLVSKVNELNQLQLDYEDLYMDRGNITAVKVAPSNLRKEMEDAVKLYLDEVNWMASQNDTEPWHTLQINLQKRFDEVTVSMIRKKKTEEVKEIIPPTATPEV